jgi:hypothetical protein
MVGTRLLDPFAIGDGKTAADHVRSLGYRIVTMGRW